MKDLGLYKTHFCTSKQVENIKIYCFNSNLKNLKQIYKKLGVGRAK